MFSTGQHLYQSDFRQFCYNSLLTCWRKSPRQRKM